MLLQTCMTQFLKQNTKAYIVKNSFGPYNESQWGSKKHWTKLTFIVWTKTIPTLHGFCHFKSSLVCDSYNFLQISCDSVLKKAKNYEKTYIIQHH